MTSRRPLLLMASIGALLVLALLAVWLVLMPYRLASSIADDVGRKTGLALLANGGSSLTFDGGLAVRMNDVTLANPAEPGVPTVTAAHMLVQLPWSRILGVGISADDIRLEDPIFTFDIAGSNDASTGAASQGAKDPARLLKSARLQIRNGQLRVRGTDGGQVLSATDINASASRGGDGAMEISGTALVNGRLTTLSASVDDARRLKTDGSPADITLSAKDNQLGFSGRALLRDGLALDGRLEAHAGKGLDFLQWLGFGLKGFESVGELSLDAGFSTRKGLATLSDMTLNAAAGGSNFTIKGKASVQAGQLRPRLDATLSANVIDLNAYRAPASGAAPAAGTTPRLTDPWQEKPFNLADLTAIDGHVLLTAEAMQIGALKTGPATLDASLEDGVAVARLSSAAVAGGKAEANVNLRVTDNVPQLGLAIATTGVDAKGFLEPLTGFGALEGPVDLTANLTAQGDSQARLVSSLGGTVTFNLEGGKLDGVALAEQLLKSGTGWNLIAGNATLFNDAAFAATLADGVASLTRAELNGDALSLRASGEVDILRQSLDLAVKPRLSTGAGSVKLPVNVAIRGNWANPEIDTEATLKPKALLRELAPAVDSELVDGTLKGVGKKAKKTIKKLFGN